MIRRPGLALAGFALVGLVGCAGTPHERDPSATRGPEEIRAEILGAANALREQGKTEQADIFTDGAIDHDEYRTALNDLQSCIESKGYSFNGPRLSPVTGITFEFVHDVNGRSEAQGVEDFTACEERYWDPLASFYLSTHDQLMDPQLKNAVLQCMEDEGLPGDPRGTNLAEISPITGDDEATRGAARECTMEEAQRLYPDLPTVTIYD